MNQWIVGILAMLVPVFTVGARELSEKIRASFDANALVAVDRHAAFFKLVPASWQGTVAAVNADYIDEKRRMNRPSREK